MATENECKFYEICGFRRWRADGVNHDAHPMPENGDCGVARTDCRRKDYGPIEVTEYGPVTHTEFDVSMPKERPSKGIHR